MGQEDAPGLHCWSRKAGRPASRTVLPGPGEAAASDAGPPCHRGRPVPLFPPFRAPQVKESYVCVLSAQSTPLASRFLSSLWPMGSPAQPGTPSLTVCQLAAPCVSLPPRVTSGLSSLLFTPCSWGLARPHAQQRSGSMTLSDVGVPGAETAQREEKAARRGGAPRAAGGGTGGAASSPKDLLSPGPPPLPCRPGTGHRTPKGIGASFHQGLSPAYKQTPSAGRGRPGGNTGAP